MALGVLIFIDDYFNCLTVGTVMRPVTDRFKITRAKLAYIIDATAAPVCIIAPVSSWAAAVTSSLPEDSAIDGFALFLETIPLNLYAWLTLIFMIILIASGHDFSRMAKYEKQSGGTLVIPAEYAEDENTAPVGNGKSSIWCSLFWFSSAAASSACCTPAAFWKERAWQMPLRTANLPEVL